MNYECYSMFCPAIQYTNRDHAFHLNILRYFSCFILFYLMRNLIWGFWREWGCRWEWLMLNEKISTILWGSSIVINHTCINRIVIVDKSWINEYKCDLFPKLSFLDQHIIENTYTCIVFCCIILQLGIEEDWDWC